MQVTSVHSLTRAGPICLRVNKAYVLQRLSPCSRAWEPQQLKPMSPRARSPRREASAVRSPHATVREQCPASTTREKPMQQQRPSKAKDIKTDFQNHSPVNICDPVDCSPPGSSVHGILQARTLEWVAMPFSRGSSQLRDRTRVLTSLALAGRFFTTSTTWVWRLP